MVEHSPPPSLKGDYALVSLGCAKNLVDSERMAGLLRLEGYRLVDNPREADFVVVNTCGFIADAREESLSAIREMVRLKEQGEVRGLIPGYAVKLDQGGRRENGISKHGNIMLHKWSYVKGGVAQFRELCLGGCGKAQTTGSTESHWRNRGVNQNKLSRNPGGRD